MSEIEKTIYAGTVYEIVYKGERVMHLRSLQDRSLIIHVSINSPFLSEYITENKERERC